MTNVVNIKIPIKSYIPRDYNSEHLLLHGIIHDYIL